MVTRPASLPSHLGVPVSIPPISLPSQSYTFLVLTSVLRIYTHLPSSSARKSFSLSRPSAEFDFILQNQL
ncbi:hypothetical protein RSOLAG1IB_12056 [Rhizoctonia solani AG-1 IB]|uniref:Uncharacterized protein n=1 Tax=Thanatephorus cucumeris (strain AG1-IB / isolate 7/3/14) TaxID=1108050 RepID=A0A0B7FHJ5_THACB|nr:hypothetical protein RSOLAG1IB_12056 [Rhizoctonia solani AG-1 IB]